MAVFLSEEVMGDAVWDRAMARFWEQMAAAGGPAVVVGGELKRGRGSRRM